MISRFGHAVKILFSSLNYIQDHFEGFKIEKNARL